MFKTEKITALFLLFMCFPLLFPTFGGPIDFRLFITRLVLVMKVEGGLSEFIKSFKFFIKFFGIVKHLFTMIQFVCGSWREAFANGLRKRAYFESS